MKNCIFERKTFFFTEQYGKLCYRKTFTSATNNCFGEKKSIYFKEMFSAKKQKQGDRPRDDFKQNFYFSSKTECKTYRTVSVDIGLQEEDNKI
jgi:hypothetical protein